MATQGSFDGRGRGELTLVGYGFGNLVWTLEITNAVEEDSGSATSRGAAGITTLLGRAYIDGLTHWAFVVVSIT